MSVFPRFTPFCTGTWALATLSIMACESAAPPPAGTSNQEVTNQLPSNLLLGLNAKNTVTIGPFSQIAGDVGSSGLTGSVLFDVSTVQGTFFGFNIVANTVEIRADAQVDNIIGNDITVDGIAESETLGLDPTALPQVPAGSPVTPGTTPLSAATNEAKQACPGQYSAITLGKNATLALNGGVYQVTRLNLADGARLAPSEPVVILVTGGMTLGTGATILPSQQALNPMTSRDIRIEVGGAITIGDNAALRAHLLAPAGKITVGKLVNLTGGAWAKSIELGDNDIFNTEDVFLAQAAAVPPPCNDNDACTTDTCESSGGVARCSNVPMTTCGSM